MKRQQATLEIFFPHIPGIPTKYIAIDIGSNGRTAKIGSNENETKSGHCKRKNVNTAKGFLPHCKQSMGVGPWWGSVTGLTRHEATIYLVPWHHHWSAKAKVITITKLMFKCDTFTLLTR